MSFIPVVDLRLQYEALRPELDAAVNRVIRHPRRDMLREFLDRQGIQTLIHYPLPVHLQPGYADLGLGRGSLPQSERAADEVLSLPMYPDLTEDQLQRVADAVCSFS